jgi:hypothetical protein
LEGRKNGSKEGKEGRKEERKRWVRAVKLKWHLSVLMAASPSHYACLH